MRCGCWPTTQTNAAWRSGSTSSITAGEIIRTAPGSRTRRVFPTTLPRGLTSTPEPTSGRWWRRSKAGTLSLAGAMSFGTEMRLSFPSVWWLRPWLSVGLRGRSKPTARTIFSKSLASKTGRSHCLKTSTASTPNSGALDLFTGLALTIPGPS